MHSNQSHDTTISERRAEDEEMYSNDFDYEDQSNYDEVNHEFKSE